MIYAGLDLNKSGGTFVFNWNNGQLNARAAIAALMLMAVTALTVTASIYPFATPVYGLAASPDGSLLVADAGAGIVEIRNGVGFPGLCHRKMMNGFNRNCATPTPYIAKRSC